jgi:NADP-dependent 3-hydroxy acid dehydrogenase YdfG
MGSDGGEKLKDFHNRVIYITGGSSGSGLATACLPVRQGGAYPASGAYRNQIGCRSD